MKRFVKDVRGGMYLEFQRGDQRRVRKHWRSGSIYMDGETAYDTGLESVLISCIEGFDPSGADFYLISGDVWNEIETHCREEGGILKEVLDEMKPWCDDVLKKEGAITIVGY